MRYGLVGEIVAVDGRRDDLLAVLLEAAGDAMPGNMHYVVHTSDAHPDSVWVTEIWESREAHAASLELASVQALIGKARPLIAGFGTRIELTPHGGYGLPS